jgi:hypothetical protein
MAKFTSGATCAAGPALAYAGRVFWVAFPGGGGLGAAAPNYRLNLMPVQQDAPSDAWSAERLLVLGETTFEQPALAIFGGTLYLAWTGTDPAHRLNLLSFTIGADARLTLKTKIVFDWTATGGPSLLSFSSPRQAPRLYLGFSGGGGLGGAAPNGELNLAWSADGADWPASQLWPIDTYHSLLSPSLGQIPWVEPVRPEPPTQLIACITGTDKRLYLIVADPQPGRLVGLEEKAGGLFSSDYPETSDYAPSLATFGPWDAANVACVWTGSGDNRHLYYVDNLQAGNQANAHQVFSDTSAFAPACIGVDEQVYVAWAGTDPAHRLNLCDFNSLTKIDG